MFEEDFKEELIGKGTIKKVFEMSDKYGIALITATHDNEFIKSFNNVYKLKDSLLSKIDE